MKQPTVLEGIGVAATISIVGAAWIAIQPSIIYVYNPFKFAIVLMAMMYIPYLLFRSPERVGRITVMLIWSAVTLISYTTTNDILVIGALQIGMMWLIRSLYYYHGIFPAIVDLFLIVFSLMITFLAGEETRSPFLTFWCFFLIQSLFIQIPKKLSGQGQQQVKLPESKDRFERAHHAAELAVRKLTRIH